MPSFGIGMINDDFHIAGIRQVVAERLKSVAMQGFLDLGDNFDSCITATLTVFLSNTTSSSVSLFPIPLALSCRRLNVLSPLICLVGGEGVKDLVGGGDCWDCGAELA